MKKTLAASLLLPLALTLACSDDDESVPTADVDGVWTFTAGGSPPTTLACNGQLQIGWPNTPLCTQFDLDLAQVGDLAGGDSLQVWCGDDFTGSFVIEGNSVEGSITMSDPPDPDQSFTFAGTVSGDSMVLDVRTFTVEGLTGNCTMTGSYNGIR